MLKIGICDMDAAFVGKLLDILDEVLYQYGDWEVQVFDDSNEIVQLIENKNFDCNLLFLEIFQQGKSGINIADYIKEKSVDTDIIFVTTSEEHVFDCYQNHTFAYLLKPLRDVDIANEVKRYLKEIQKSPKCLNISNRGVVTRIPLDTILYIESVHRKLIIHTKHQNYSYYQKLDVIEELLRRDHFIRCHQSYLVPVERIMAYDGNVIKIGEHGIPVSRRYKENVKYCLAQTECAMSGDVDSSMSDETDLAESEQDCIELDNAYLTSGVFQDNDTKGALICVRGAYLGNIIRIVPEQKIIIGRDGTAVDMIVNLPLVSREHCSIIYHEADQNYEVQDYSMNGTFIDGTTRLEKGIRYLLQPGTMISFGDTSTVYRLG